MEAKRPLLSQTTTVTKSDRIKVGENVGIKSTSGKIVPRSFQLGVIRQQNEEEAKKKREEEKKKIASYNKVLLIQNT